MVKHKHKNHGIGKLRVMAHRTSIREACRCHFRWASAVHCKSCQEYFHDA